ncbi:hypothetical protein [Pseudogemmobacter sp. W21_MBD1_M6]|uniref:hypothetical protein n=1 Tax=Pseudogemmobacter sp. W21_MBD1_M6 TaxID=3240271 RepID=UPI003F9E1395
MARSEQNLNTVTDLIKQAQGIFAVTPLVTSQTDRLWAAQDKILSETEQFFRHWFARRHEAARTAMQTAKAVSSKAMSDPAAAITAITDWQTHSMQRLIEDSQECAELYSRCTAHLVNEEIHVTEDVTKMGTRAAKAAEAVPV